MAWLFSPQTLALFRRLKKALDPRDLANPDKLIPLEKDKSGPGFRRPPLPELSAQARRLVAQVQGCAQAGRSMLVRGSRSRLSREPSVDWAVLETAGLASIVEVDDKNYTVTIEGGISMRLLHDELGRRGCHVRLPETGGTLGGLLATKSAPALRDDILGMRLLLADGSVCELGGKVVKNVAGYDVPRMMLGSCGTLAVILEVTMKLYAGAVFRAPFAGQGRAYVDGPWQRRVKQAFDPGNLLNPWLTP